MRFSYLSGKLASRDQYKASVKVAPLENMI